MDSGTVIVGAGNSTDVAVVYSQELDRPLNLTGIATGKNSDGSIAVDFYLETPDILTETEFRKYVAGKKLGHPYYELAVDIDGVSQPLTLGRETGRVGTLATSTGTWEINELSDQSLRVIKGDSTMTITLANTGYKSTSPWSSGLLIEKLMHGPIACTEVAGTTSKPCSLRYSKTKFAPP